MIPLYKINASHGHGFLDTQNARTTDDLYMFHDFGESKGEMALSAYPLLSLQEVRDPLDYNQNACIPLPVFIGQAKTKKKVISQEEKKNQLLSDSSSVTELVTKD